MADWFLRLRDTETDNIVGEYSVQQPSCEIRNSEVGSMSAEIALGQKKRNQPLLGIARDEFAPRRTTWEMWRQSSGAGICLNAGQLTSCNLNFNRDTVLVAGKDWKEYLQHRIYPFTPEDYIEYSGVAESMFFDKWPKKWAEVLFPGTVPIRRIIRDLLLSMRSGIPVDYLSTTLPLNVTATGSLPITWNIAVTGGPEAMYKIYPGDQTTIYDHINKLSELSEGGFEWDITPLTMEFRLWMPTKYTGVNPVYHLIVSDQEANGQITEFDWTNDGPDGTYLLGLGSGGKTGAKIGATWTYIPSLEQFSRLDLVYNYGEMQDYDTILDKLKDQNDLHPQKKLALTLLNPEYLVPNFYTADRPRSLIANSIRVTRDFSPYHKVDAYFKINAMTFGVDASTNEYVSMELMMIYEPEGTSGGLTP